ncbi:hypothetical protein [Glycomyces albidus]|jgi:hypothetical protein|uniref:DUF3817 domain-containing protein n=1 Tax=Glycomyces albidus TaxID=2656774 RepID=A0A6L5GDB2_9ACTN|nr:hypothetical protein [Glycomyces albidus]MQM27628.1 hypothetical protein [Glycomyces albidus]
MEPRRVLHLIGAVELSTFLLMMANLATVHLQLLSSILGPLHGLAYTLTVIAAALLSQGRHRVWLLALVPAVGGLLAARALPAPDATV